MNRVTAGRQSEMEAQRADDSGAKRRCWTVRCSAGFGGAASMVAEASDMAFSRLTTDRVPGGLIVAASWLRAIRRRILGPRTV